MPITWFRKWSMLPSRLNAKRWCTKFGHTWIRCVSTPTASTLSPNWRNSSWWSRPQRWHPAHWAVPRWTQPTHRRRRWPHPMVLQPPVSVPSDHHQQSPQTVSCKILFLSDKIHRTAWVCKFANPNASALKIIQQNNSKQTKQTKIIGDWIAYKLSDHLEFSLTQQMCVTENEEQCGKNIAFVLKEKNPFVIASDCVIRWTTTQTPHDLYLLCCPRVPKQITWFLCLFPVGFPTT